MLHLPEEYRKQIIVIAIATIVITGAFAASAIYLLLTPTKIVSAPLVSGAQSHLVLQLTDPPVVPAGTTSLLLTYNEIDLIVATSGTSQNNITILPSGGSATLGLLALQNVSRTLESTNVPTGSQIVSAVFHVSQMTITVNDTTSPVSVATGGNSLIVSLPNLVVPSGNNALLFELNPTILNTSAGYQMVPSSTGVFIPASEITPTQETVGYTHALTDADQNELHHEKGSIGVSLLGFSVSDTTTSLNLQITDTGTMPEHLLLIGIHGDFDPVCSSSDTSTTTTTRGGESSTSSNNHDKNCKEGTNEILFIPGAPQTTSVSTTYSGCAPRHMTLSSDGRSNSQILPIVMNPSQCLNFGYSGILSINGHNGDPVVIPSLKPGMKYVFHVVASNGAQVKLECTIHANSAPTCTDDHGDGDSD